MELLERLGGRGGREERETEKEAGEGGRTSGVRRKREGHPRGVGTLAGPVLPGVLDQAPLCPGWGAEPSMLTSAGAIEQGLREAESWIGDLCWSLHPGRDPWEGGSQNSTQRGGNEAWSSGDWQECHRTVAVNTVRCQCREQVDGPQVKVPRRQDDRARGGYSMEYQEGRRHWFGEGRGRGTQGVCISERNTVQGDYTPAREGFLGKGRERED